MGFTLDMVPQGAHTSMLFHSYGMADFSGQVNPKKESIRLKTGDTAIRWGEREILEETCIDIHLLKVDVEGAEFAVLRGLEPLFSEHRVRFLFLEFWPIALMGSGTDPLGMLKWLAHYGFHCRFLGTIYPPETFEEFIARHTEDHIMSDFNTVERMSFNDLLCEDFHWHDPCGWEAAAAEARRHESARLAAAAERQRQRSR